MLDFARRNFRWLLPGLLLTLSSSFGQTFFIAIFAEEIRGEFGLSHAGWGGIYTVATITSAGAMHVRGGLADRFGPRQMTVAVLALYVAICVGMGVTSLWLLPVFMAFLRFCGQGMATHIALVTVSRWFIASRGLALSITSMGVALGQAALPFLFVLIIGMIGWRGSWFVAAGILSCFLVLLWVLLGAERKPMARQTTEEQDRPGLFGRHWTRGAMLRHWLFWVAMPGVLAQPVFSTAFFFNQVHLTDLKEWPPTSFVPLIAFFTMTSLVSLVLTGRAVDRYGSGRVFPFVMLPMAVAFVLFATGTTLTTAAIAFTVLGISQGGGTTIAANFWPEFYGTRFLGAVRSVASSLMVFGTAIGPGITGFLIDAGIDFRAQLVGMAVYVVVVSGLLAAILPRTGRSGGGDGKSRTGHSFPDGARRKDIASVPDRQTGRRHTHQTGIMTRHRSMHRHGPDHITAPICQGTNSLSPSPSASDFVTRPDAVARIRSKIARPLSAMGTPPDTMSPVLRSMSSGICANSRSEVASLIVGAGFDPKADPRPVVNTTICAPPAICPVADTGS